MYNKIKDFRNRCKIMKSISRQFDSAYRYNAYYTTKHENRTPLDGVHNRDSVSIVFNKLLGIAFVVIIVIITCRYF